MNVTDFRVNPNDLAGKGERLANYIIDLISFYIVVFAFSFIIAIIVALTGGDVDAYADSLDGANPLAERLIFMLLYGLYMVLIEFLLKGRSIGKLITKTQVVLKNGTKPTINETVVRNMCRLIPFDQLSFLGKDGKGWHDSLSKTYVVKTKNFEERRTGANDLEMIGKAQED